MKKRYIEYCYWNFSEYSEYYKYYLVDWLAENDAICVFSNSKKRLSKYRYSRLKKHYFISSVRSTKRY